MATNKKADEREPLLNSSNNEQSTNDYEYSNGKPYIVEFDKKGDPDNPQELDSRLPQPPTQADRIVFLTDISNFKQCTVCLWEEELPADALRHQLVDMVP